MMSRIFPPKLLSCSPISAFGMTSAKKAVRWFFARKIGKFSLRSIALCMTSLSRSENKYFLIFFVFLSRPPIANATKINQFETIKVYGPYVKGQVFPLYYFWLGDQLRLTAHASSLLLQ